MNSKFWLESGVPTPELREALSVVDACEFTKHLLSALDDWEKKPLDANWEWYLHCKMLFENEYKDVLSEGKPVRRAISKSVRFEVFKRDSFTCQYCGSKAPDVVLHVDHLVPVSAGGENDLMNLITSCEGCNLGKSDKFLDDHSMLSKQRDQIEQLNERRQQLQMLLEWRDGLATLEDECVQAVQSALGKYSSWIANENGVRDIRKWLKKHPLPDLLKALDTSFCQYLTIGADGKADSQSWNRAFSMVPRIASVNARGGMPEDLQRAFYARGILRRRLDYIREADVMRLMKDAMAAGLDPDELVGIAKDVRNWREFENIMYTWIAGK